METRATMILIRDMHADDVSQVMKIERSNFNEPWAEMHFYFELYTKTSHNWVAEIDKELCGYMCFWHIEDEIHLNNIAVARVHQRKGVGQHMLDKLIEYALKLNCRIITLEVSELNNSAIGFYKRNEFEQVGLRPNYYVKDKADALILTKELEKM
jgi:ribosomal-protein-alanine N-acetyltransferase